MEQGLMVDNLVTLGLLTLLQAVLGFDNLLYISLESKRAPAQKQAMVRRLGIGLAVFLRIILLFVVMKMIKSFQDPIFGIHLPDIIDSDFNLHSIIVLLGGVFIIYTATKEILHMLSLEEVDHDVRSQRSVGMIIFWIVAMNLVFSFDSILSALAISKVFAVLATAIVVSGLLMLLMANRVSEFLKKNRKYEVLGLFILLIVGVVLLGEGGHVAHLKLFGYAVEPMAKTTFYFSIAVLVAVDVIQSGFQRKLATERARQQSAQKAQSTSK